MPKHQDEEREKTALAKFVANLAYAQVSNRLGSVTVATESLTFFKEGYRSFYMETVLSVG